MAHYRSAMGKMVDMDALASKNEHVRAVGNMNVNARGDTVDSHGRVIKPVNEKVTQSYAKTVGNKPQSKVIPARPQPKKEELTEMERELEDSFEDDLAVENIKAQELKGKK